LAARKSRETLSLVWLSLATATPVVQAKRPLPFRSFAHHVGVRSGLAKARENQIRLPGAGTEALLVVVVGFGEPPLMLVINPGLRARDFESLWRTVET